MNQWFRVTRRQPCPQCGKPDWCTRSADGKVVLCMRISSDRPSRGKAGGWLHAGDAAPVAVRPHEAEKPIPRAELAALCQRWATGIDPKRFADFASSMGLAESSLKAIGIGWAFADDLERQGTRCKSIGCWTFPMRDATGAVVGVRLRGADGFKYSLRGGSDGLFYSPPAPSAGQVVIVEGPTDCAALVGLGLPAIGRSSCATGADLLADMVHGLDVAIIADHDAPHTATDGRVFFPGQDGAKRLAASLAPHARSVKVLVVPFVKDVRDWVKAGAGPQTIRSAIAGANYWRRNKHG